MPHGTDRQGRVYLLANISAQLSGAESPCEETAGAGTLEKQLQQKGSPGCPLQTLVLALWEGEAGMPAQGQESPGLPSSLNRFCFLQMSPLIPGV